MSRHFDKMTILFTIKIDRRGGIVNENARPSLVMTRQYFLRLYDDSSFSASSGESVSPSDERNFVTWSNPFFAVYEDSCKSFNIRSPGNKWY